MITLSENFRALFYTPFYAAHAIGAYEAEKVEVRLRDSPDPARTAADLRSGRIDVMWGGPLRVLLTHAADPASDVVCFCDVVARDPFFIIGREPRADFRPRDLQGLRFASVAEVPTPWLCLQDDIRRDGADPAALNRTSGPSMAENTEALRAGRLDAIQVFQPYAEELLQSGAGICGTQRPNAVLPLTQPWSRAVRCLPAGETNSPRWCGRCTERYAGSPRRRAPRSRVR